MRKAHHREVKDYGRSQVRNLGKEDMVTHYRKPSIDNQVYLTLFCFNSFLFLLFSLFSAGGGGASVSSLLALGWNYVVQPLPIPYQH